MGDRLWKSRMNRQRGLSFIFVVTLGLLFGAFSASSSRPDLLPDKVAAVQEFSLEKDYPEVIGGQHYKTRIENVIVSDQQIARAVRPPDYWLLDEVLTE